MPRWRLKYQKICSLCILISIGILLVACYPSKEVILRDFFTATNLFLFMAAHLLNCMMTITFSRQWSYVKTQQVTRWLKTSLQMMVAKGWAFPVCIHLNSQLTNSSRSIFSGMPPTLAPLPGILKSRVKHKHSAVMSGSVRIYMMYIV